MSSTNHKDEPMADTQGNRATEAPGVGTTADAHVPATVWWKVTAYYDKPSPITIIRHTDKTVTYMDKAWGKPKERRANRRGIYEEWFETASAAWDAIEQRYVREMTAALQRADTAADKLAKVRAARP